VADPAQQPFISFLSDYGLEDAFVGVCHGVIARLCPEARVIDLTHGIPRHDVLTGALTLRNALPHLPVGVHLAVVDPTVGARGRHARRAVALRTASEGRILVGPDNGVLSLAAERLGGIVDAVDVGRSPYRLQPVSATFHGRDIFAPVAAALAGGAPLADAGEPIPIDDLATVSLPQARAADDGLYAHVVALDRFGNVILDAGHDQLGSAGLRLGAELALTAGGREHRARFVTTFADVAPGELLLYEDAEHMAALAVNHGSAAQTLGVQRAAELHLRQA
jgi:S-adenosylmethionine hydrolase